MSHNKKIEEKNTVIADLREQLVKLGEQHQREKKAQDDRHHREREDKNREMTELNSWYREELEAQMSRHRREIETMKSDHEKAFND